MMVISNFLPRVILRDDDHDPCNTDAKTNCNNSARRWNNRNTSIISGRLQELANSPPIIIEIARTPSKPSTLQLHGNAKHLNPRIACHGELEPEDPQMPMPYLADEVIRNLKKNDKSPPKSPSRNFVKKLVTALEGKRHSSVHCKADEEFVMCYNSKPTFTYIKGTTPKTEIKSFLAHHHCDGEQITEFRGVKVKDETCSQIRNNETRRDFERHQWTEIRGGEIEDETRCRIGNNETNRNYDRLMRTEVLHDVEFDEETCGPIKTEESEGARPKYRGTITKKPVCLESRSIYKTPEKRKTIPRKRSFKNLILTLTDWAGRKKVSKVILPTGEKTMNQPRGRTSLQFTNNDSSLPENIDCDARGNNSTFSTFLKSSSSKNLEENPKAGNSESDSNFSVMEESMDDMNIRPSRVKQIAQRLSNLPNHPWTESKFRRPYLPKTSQNVSATCGEVVELRRNLNESLYDTPNPRPRSNECEETIAMKRKHSSFPNATGYGHPLYVIKEETHYAIVRPKTIEGCVSYENPDSIRAGSSQDPIGEMKLKLKKIERRETTPRFGDERSNKSLVVFV